MRKRKCRHCMQWFYPEPPEALVCSPECALPYGRVLAEKQAKKALKARREALKTKSWWLKEADKAFNRFIRKRDETKPCVSCGTWSPSTQLKGGSWDCGHFLTKGAHPELRFEELNAHKQCKKCNRDRSGNVGNYRKELIRRIGIDKVEWLEGPHDPKKYTIDDLKAIRKHYQQKIKELSDLSVVDVPF